MAAVTWEAADNARAERLLADIRERTGRRADHLLHFVKLNHHARLAAVSAIGAEGVDSWIRVITVSVCKRELPPPPKGFDEDKAYLWSYRLLLERLSWLARAKGCNLDLTLAHITRFKKETLRKYEETLRGLDDCNVEWKRVPRGASISTPREDERLQLADIAASATFQAFEQINGFTEQRYLAEMKPVLWRRNGNLLSYGLKVVPKPSGDAYHWCSEM